ncbi:hypothetical protein HDK90DRAFT_316529 [Phyllosticta capitalensis]|uniref:DUF7924 domain-containing protein n=1 Tax=Phyllosticta capitalensis TaxID=121624 RepID=A0ABR1YLA4_9PEZI
MEIYSGRRCNTQKRQRPTSTTAEDAHRETAGDDADSNNPIDYWRKHLHWPRTYFESNVNMSNSLTRKKSDSMSRTSRMPSDVTPSDDKQKEAKRASYRHAGYEILLSAKGIYMDDADLGVSKASKDLCGRLLAAEQTTPRDSLFNDEIFERTCRKIQNRNEAKVVQDISRLIVPSAETLALHGNKKLDNLVESVSEMWTESMVLIDTQPSPHYSVGFIWSAFTPKQMELLKPWLGELLDLSVFKATYFMHFPFLTCEVKCGAETLNIADRQNVHSATLAVRAVVELFRLVKREKEVDREILAFSVSHDDSSVRIYGHYPVIDGKDTKYYRHPIHIFDFTAMDGKDKWTAYKFTKNVYDNWMPDHFKRICSAIDEIPDNVNFDVSQESELQFSSQSGLSQELESHHLSQSEGSASVAGREDASGVAPKAATPDTSVSALQSFKKPRRK